MRIEGFDHHSTYFLKIAKLPRLYRLFKITRLFKVLKVINKTLTNRKFKKLLRKYRNGIRLLSLLFTVILFTHLASCLWIFMAKINDFSPDTWVF